MNRNRSALTLLEMIISAAVLSMMLSAVTLSLNSGAQFSDRVTRQTGLDERANAIVNSLAQELRNADGNSGSLLIPSPSLNPVVVYQYAVSKGIVPFNAPTEPYIDANGNGAYDVGEQFNDTNGNGVWDNTTVPSWTTSYETNSHRLTYDKTTGTITKRVFNADGTFIDTVITDQVAPVTVARPYGGFVVQQVGTTLQMTLTLQTTNRTGDTILYTAQSQVLFLRSTLNTASGSCPTIEPDYGTLLYNYGVKPPPPSSSYWTSYSNYDGPNISIGNLITLTSDPAPNNQQISIIFSAPVGKVLDQNQFYIFGCLNDGLNNWRFINAAGTTVLSTGTGTTVSLDRQMQVTNDGVYTITLTGEVDTSILLFVEAGTTTYSWAYQVKSF